MLRKRLPNNSRSGGAPLWGLILVLLTLAAMALMWGVGQPVITPIARTGLPVLGRVPAFQLTNQLGQPVALSNLLGKIWIADIIFTRCAGPCPVMTRQMSELQPLLESHPDLCLVTLTTDPAYDSPEVLKKYGDKFGATSPRWLFLTGAKPEIARLALEGLRLAAVEKGEKERENPADLFIHSTMFVVVDQQGRLRAAVETQDDPPEEGKTSTAPPRWTTESKQRLADLVAQLQAERKP